MVQGVFMSDSSNTPINPQDMAADLAKNVDKAARKVVSLTDKGPIKGFKKFISRGSMIDMAVGVVMGSAVTTVVNSIVNHLISPLIGMIGGVPDMSGVLTITFNGATISFGAILNAIINFLLIGVAVYLCIVLPINKLRDMGANEEAKNTEPTTEEQTLAVLQEIRDELKRTQPAGADKQ
jgi:large conductance mechanosensitive channel